MAVTTVRTVLVNASAVTTLVPQARIEPLRRTQSIAIPAITIQTSSAVPVNHLRGASLDGNQVQVDYWGRNYDEARAVADAGRAALAAAGHIMTLELDGHDSDVDPELFRITQTWEVWT